MNTQQADDVIAELLPLKAEGRHILDAKGDYIAVVHGFEELASRRAAALVERVSRQPHPQEVDGEFLDRLEEVAVWLDENAPVGHSTPWLVRRDLVREAGRQLAASVSHQPVDAPIAPVVVNSQQEPQERPPSADLVARLRRQASIMRQPCRPPFVRAYGEDDYQHFAEVFEAGARALEVADQEIAALLASRQQEPPKEPVLRQALKEIRYICRDVELGNWFAPDAIEHIIVACESVDDQPAAEGSQPVLRRDPCGCLHDGSRIVEWCTRSGQTHEGHEEEQRTKKS